MIMNVSGVSGMLEHVFVHAHKRCNLLFSQVPYAILAFSVRFSFCTSAPGGTALGRLPLAPKWVHLAWQVVAFILTTIGYVAIVVNKGTMYTHMDTVHAYVGILVLVCYYLQVRRAVEAQVSMLMCVTPCSFSEHGQ